MSWHKVDDKFAAHPKVERLEELGAERHAFAIAAWTLLGSDCALLDDGGVIAPARVRKVLQAWPEKRRERAIEDLISVGLLDKTTSGVAFHDWEEYRRRDRSAEERAEYERRKKAAQRARSRENTTDSVNVPGTCPPNVPDHDSGTVPAPRARVLPTRPDPSRPVQSREGDGFAALVWSLWKDTFGRVPDVGTADNLDRMLSGELLTKTREESRSLERLRALQSLAPPDDPSGWLRRALGAFQADPWAKREGYPWPVFVSRAGELAAKAKPNHAPGDFGDPGPIEDRLPPEVLALPGVRRG